MTGKPLPDYADAHAAWQRLPGSSRTYQRVDTGQILSRRQYDKMQEAADKRVHVSASGGGTAPKTKAYAEFARRYAKRHRITTRQARASINLKEHYHTLTHSKLVSKKIEALKAMGMRDGIPDYVPPGQSDKYRSAQASRSAYGGPRLAA